MALRALALLGGLGVFFLSRLARADCPDGWFCDDKPSSPPATEPAPDAARPPPEGTESPEPTAAAPVSPTPTVLVEEPEQPPPARRHRHRREQEVGLNLHLDLGVLGSGAQSNSFMGGGGFAFRLRPWPVFALDLGLEVVGGVDYNGNDRTEEAVVVNALAFVNPRDRVQFFLLAGFDLGGASVQVRKQSGMPVTPLDDRYGYFGAQTGCGLEWRLARHTAITSDFQLFLRGRTDAGRDVYPEYTNPVTHLATNSSGGGLLRLGVTLYF
jgi:hypothetical protein